MKKTFLLFLTTLLFFACSGDDDSSSSLDSLNQTDWEFSSGNTSFSIYFATSGNTVTITNSGIHMTGSYTYGNPSVEMDYTESCGENAYIFSECIINGNINGSQLRIVDNGEEYIFNRINED